MRRGSLLLISALLVGTIAPAFSSGGSYDEAPPTLDYYLQRLPAKSISQVMDDSGITPATKPPLVLNPTQLITDFAAGPSPSLVQKIDDLIVQERAGYSGAAEINLLQDLRDLAASSATGPEASAYVKWRFDHRDWFAGKPLDAWEKPKLDPARPPELDERIKTSSPELLPHWLYLKGALYYKAGNDTDSEVCFDRVLKEFPNDARAESAAFMKARCKLSQSVVTYDTPDDSKKDTAGLLVQARTLFQDYLNKYPHGRYRNDVTGWLGATAYRTDDYATALGYYIQQTETKDHPEDFRPAVVMIEKCLYHIRATGTTDIDQIAQHPPIALAFVYFTINTAFPKDDGTSAEEIATMTAWRQDILPKLAEAVLAHKELYQGQAGQEKYLAILAQASSDQGNQPHALDLIKLAGPKATTESDDLAYAQALALQRNGALDDAVSAYRAFLTRFPKSPLIPGAHYRLGLALHDQKKDGDALLEFASLRNNHLPLRALPPANLPADASVEAASPEPVISAIGIDYSGASDAQIDQTMDTLLNFAPIDSLKTALVNTDTEHTAFRNDLRQVLQERCLAHEDYVGAASFADSDELKKTFNQLGISSTQPKSSDPNPALAKACAGIADWWATKARLLISTPLDSPDATSFLFADDSDLANLRRCVNGPSLAFTQPDTELENREEWRHAIQWWLQAVTADPQGELAPKALWQAIQAQRKIVEMSPYTETRAAETDANAATRQLYDQLVTQYPKSVEARQFAVYWTFPTKADLAKAQKHGDAYLRGSRYRDDYSQLPYNWAKAIGVTDANGYRDIAENWQPIRDALVKLPERTRDLSRAEFTFVVASQWNAARNATSTMACMPVVNCLEDLRLIAQVPELDSDLRAQYVALRVRLEQTSIAGGGYPEDNHFNDDQLRKDIAAFAKKPGTESIHDFIDFLNLAVTANHLINVTAPGLEKDGQPMTYKSRDFPLLARQAKTFLAQYPHSPKREAASILELRALVLGSRPRMLPDKDYKLVPVVQTPFNAAAFQAALKAYSTEFPHGAYPNAVLSYRADAALLTQQWSEALDTLLALHAQDEAPEFQQQVATELTAVFDQLDDNAQRHNLLQLIQQRPVAIGLLKTYLEVGGLPYLKDYLTAQATHA